MGVEINPADIDIIAYTDDFFKMREIFSAYTIEPFVDNHQDWILRYFARICVDGCQVEIAADESRPARKRQTPLLINLVRMI